MSISLIGGYWDPQTRQCIPFSALPQKDEPIFAEISSRTIAPTAAPNSLFGPRPSRTTGCAEAPNQLCENSSAPVLSNLEMFGQDGGKLTAAPKTNETITINFSAQTCSQGTGDLEAEYSFDGAEFVPINNQDGVFTFSLTVPEKSAGVPCVLIINLSDTERDSTIVKQYDIYTKTAGNEPEKFDINVSYPSAGLIPRETIVFRALTKGAIVGDLSDFQYEWSVVDISGIEVAAGEEQDFPFTPQVSGKYNVVMKVKKDGAEVETLSLVVVIQPYPEPGVAISGPQHPKAGDEELYHAVLLPTKKEHASENVSCSWEFTPISGGDLPQVDFSETEGSCEQDLPFTFPAAISSEATYLVSVLVKHNEGLFETVSLPLVVTVHPLGINYTGADFSVAYPSEGSVPFREFLFSASLANLPKAAADYDLIWEITQNDTALEKQPPKGGTTNYSFPAEGIYKVTMTVSDPASGEKLVKTEQTIKISPFPAPDLTLNLNFNQPIYINEGAIVSAHLNRSWKEDTNAAYEWEVVNLTDPEAASGCVPSENSNLQSCLFTVPGLYSISVKVTGINTEYSGEPIEAYQLEKSAIVQVGEKWTGLPEVNLIGPSSALIGETVTFKMINPTIGNTYALYANGVLVEEKVASAENIVPEGAGSALLFTYTPTELGLSSLILKVKTPGGVENQSSPLTVYVGEPQEFNSPPSATISTDLKYSYHVGEHATNITGLSDQDDAAFSWTVTRPGPNNEGEVIETFEGNTIPDYLFDLPGTYVFKLEVTSADGLYKTFDTRSVQVYENIVTMPEVNLIGPPAAIVGEPVTYKMVNPTLGVTYSLYANGVLVEEKVTSADNIVPDGNGTALLFEYIPTETGLVSLVLKAKTPGGVENQTSMTVYVGEPQEFNAAPSAVISSELKYSYHVGDHALNITGLSDQEDAVFTWTITRPGPNSDGNIIEVVEGKTIPDYLFDLNGTYFFKLEVVSADGLYKSYDTKSVQVYEGSVAIPEVNLIGPAAATVSEPAVYKMVNPALGTTYSLFANGVLVEEKVAVSGNVVPDANGTALTFTYVPTEVGLASLTLKAKTPGGAENKISLSVYVGGTQEFNSAPSATIATSLKYSYHVGNHAQNITGLSDQEDAAFAWTVTRPGPNAGGQIIELFAGSVIPDYLFDLAGTYVFKLEVTSADGLYKSYDLRSVQVYENELPIPYVSIKGPASGKINTLISFWTNNPEVGTNFDLYVDGMLEGSIIASEGNIVIDQSGSHLIFEKTFSQTGIYKLSIKATNLFGVTNDSGEWSIYIGE